MKIQTDPVPQIEVHFLDEAAYMRARTGLRIAARRLGIKLRIHRVSRRALIAWAK